MSTCLTLPPPPIGPGPRYLVGVDGSEPSIGALRWALHQAAGRSVEIVAVSMWQFPSVGLERPSQARKIHAETEAMLREAVEQALAAAGPRAADVPVTTEVYQYPPADRLVDMSSDADLVVVGRRSKRGLAALGSVSGRVATHAHCPVVVIPPEISLRSG